MESKEWKEMLENFDGFQEILDNDVMTTEDLQEWCAHMNFVIKEIIINIKTEFNKFRDMEFVDKNGEPVDIIKEPHKDFGGFYS